jgi:predicted Rossmann fold flavoprotein
VTAIQPPHDSERTFTIEHTQGITRATRLVLATGGRSLPRSGSDGFGFELARRLGHTVTPTCAALVPMVLDESFFHAALSGISHEAELCTFVGGKMIDRRQGSLLWTHFGISGPLAMDASRHWVMAQESGKTPRMECKLLPGQTLESVDQWLVQGASAHPKTSVASAITARLPERAARAIVAHAGIDPAVVCGQLPRQGRRTLAAALTHLTLPILRHRGWNYAEVTAGGIPLDEISYRTMESRKLPGLYLAGEILDCDGRIGGFNFQWAWATGCLAGKAAAGSPRAGPPIA